FRRYGEQLGSLQVSVEVQVGLPKLLVRTAVFGLHDRERVVPEDDYVGFAPTVRTLAEVLRDLSQLLSCVCGSVAGERDAPKQKRRGTARCSRRGDGVEPLLLVEEPHNCPRNGVL